MTASTNWEKTWDAEVAEINEANAARTATTFPEVWRVSVSTDTQPLTPTELAWPEEAWFPLNGIRG